MDRLAISTLASALAVVVCTAGCSEDADSPGTGGSAGSAGGTSTGG